MAAEFSYEKLTIPHLPYDTSTGLGQGKQLPCQPFGPDGRTGSRGKGRLFRAECLICLSTSDMFQKFEEIMFKGPTL